LMNGIGAIGVVAIQRRLESDRMRLPFGNP
jgi:hypothetical protein